MENTNSTQTEPKINSSVSVHPISDFQSVNKTYDLDSLETSPEALVNMSLDSSAPSYTPVIELTSKRLSRRKITIWMAGAVFVLLLAAGVSLVAAANVSWQNKNKDAENRAKASVVVPDQETLQNTSGKIAQAKKVTINGELRVNSGFIISPGTQPETGTAGQLYYNAVTKQLVYYDGSSFQDLTTRSVMDESVKRIVGLEQTATTLLTQLAQLGPATSDVKSITAGTANLLITNSGGNIRISDTTANDPKVSSINSQSGGLLLQGTSNRISVNTAGGTFTITTPQDINTTSSPTFAAITVGTLNASGAVTFASTLTLSSLNCTGNANGGALTTNGTGQIICSDDDGGAGGGGTISSVGGTTGRLPVFTGAQTIADSIVVQAATVITINGDLSTTGAASAASFTGNGSGLTSVNATQFNSQSASFYQDAGNINAGTLSNLRLNANVTLLGQTIGNAEIENNAVSLATQTTGNYVGDVTAGNGVSVGGSAGEGTSRSIALGALTADYMQGGAFDLVLNNSSSELRILEAGVTPTFYGSFDVADLGSDKTYLFPDFTGASAEVCLSTNNCVGGGAGGSAPNDVSYLTLGTHLGLTNERVLTNGSNIAAFTDGGANGTLTIATIANPIFGTSVTTPILQSTASLTLDAGSDILLIDASDTTIRRTAAGTYTFDLSDGVNTTFFIDNSGAGTANLRVSGLNAVGCDVKADTNGNLTCGIDAGASGTGDDIFVIGVAADNANFVNTAATGTIASLTWNLNAGNTPDDISLTVGNASATEAGVITTGIQTLAGAKTFTGLATFNGALTVEAGDTFTFNGEAFTDLSGTGLTFSGGTLNVDLGTSINLTSEVGSTILPIANGGTNASSTQAAINNLSQLTTEGDLLFRNATNSTRLARGSNGECLTATTTTIVWGSCQPGGSGVTTIGAIDSQAAAGNGAVIAGTSLYMQSASASNPGLVNNTTQTFSGNKTFSGNAILQGDVSLGDASTDLLTISAVIQGANPLVFEGATANGFETTLAMADPTANVTYRFAVAAGGTGSYDVCTTDGNCVGAGGGTAPNNGEYITYSANATLSAERVLTAGSNIGSIDLGTPGQAIINVAAAPTFTGLATFNGALTVEAGDTFTFNGEAFTDLSGTGLTFSGGTLNVDLGTSINLTSEVGSTILPIANGGTNASSTQAAINNLSQLTTEGDLLFRNATNSTRLARGSNGECLTATTTTIVWGSCQPGGSGVTTIGAIDSQAAAGNGAVIAGTSLYMQSASASNPGLVNNTTQTFSGNKTFSGNFLQSGSGTFGTGTGTVSLNGNTDLAAAASLATKKGTDYTTAGSANNVAISTASLYRLDTSGSAQVITGIVAGRDGQTLTLINADVALNVTINNEDAASTAANRITTGTNNPVILLPNSTTTLVYDTGASRWRVVGDLADSGCTTCARTDLSNLSSVAINADLIAGTTNTRDLGSNAIRFKDLYLQGTATIAGTINGLTLSSTQVQSSSSLALTAAVNQNLTLTRSGTGNLVFTGFDCSGAGNGGKLTVNASSQVVCSADTGAGPATTLQQAYDNSASPAIVLTADAKNIQFNLANTTTDSNFIVNTQTSSTSKFATQYNGADTFSITNAASAQGSALFKNAADNASAFMVQNTSSQSVLGVNTSTGSVLLGQASALTGKLVVYNSANANTITLTAGTTASSYNLILPTTAGASGDCLKNTGTAGTLTFGTCGTAGSNAKKVILTAEYTGYVLDPDTTNNIGTMTSAFDAAQRESYFMWTTTQGTNQDYDIVVQIPLPSDFSSLNGANPITINRRTSDITNGIITAQLKDTSGANVTNWNTCSLTPGSANTWTTTAGCAISTGTYAADGILTLRLHIQSPTSGDVRVGNITINYNSAY